MHVSYFYDAPIPSRKAAWIQILNTCHALAQRGPSVTVYSGPLTVENPAACLAFYGLPLHDNLRIDPLFTGSFWKNPLSACWNLQKVLHRPPPAERHVLLSRDDVSLRLFRKLRWMRLGPPHRYVHEAHHLCFAHFREQLGDPGPGPSGLWTRFRIRRARRLENMVVSNADGLVCLTERVRVAMHHTLEPSGPALVLPSGTALSTHDPPGDDARDIDILYAGKLLPRKGVHELVEAMRYLPGYRLWVIGGVRQQRIDELAEHAAAVGAAKRVRFTGFVKPTQVRDFYRRARVGVCPLPTSESLISKHFTSPLKILDMMACGTPIVATDLPAVRTLITHDQTALLANPDDPQALAYAIRTLLEDRPLAQRLARAARRQATAFSWGNRARRLHVFLQSIG